VAYGDNMVRLTGCSALVLAVSILTRPCVAQVEVFKDQEALENTFRSSTPEGTACKEGGSFRQMYEYELAHCIYEGEESHFRLALTHKAVLVDIEQKTVGNNREKRFEDEVEYYLQKLDFLLSMYDFSTSEAMKCVADGWNLMAQDPAAVKGDQLTGIRRTTYVLGCSVDKTGVALIIQKNNFHDILQSPLPR
jgi:hypothetical protein